MSLRSVGTIFVCKLAAASCVLALLSCGHSPSAPAGMVQVYVSENGAGPAPGKRVEIPDMSVSKTTDKNGLALFIVRPGTHIVRAYEIGTPGPWRPFVEKTVEVAPGGTSRVQFIDCTMCASPAR